MKRWLSLMLLVGAMLGLFAQEAAFASAPSMQMSEQVTAPAGMSEDCAEMMGLSVHSDLGQQPEKPCDGMTLDCVAKMGCASAIALVPVAPSDLAIEIVLGEPTLMPVSRLVGRNLRPEPEPPARLG